MLSVRGTRPQPLLGCDDQVLLEELADAPVGGSEEGGRHEHEGPAVPQRQNVTGAETNQEHGDVPHRDLVLAEGEEDAGQYFRMAFLRGCKKTPRPCLAGSEQREGSRLAYLFRRALHQVPGGRRQEPTSRGPAMHCRNAVRGPSPCDVA